MDANMHDFAVGVLGQLVRVLTPAALVDALRETVDEDLLYIAAEDLEVFEDPDPAPEVINIWVDGGCYNNQDRERARAYYSIQVSDFYTGKYLDLPADLPQTNNVAEHWGIYQALVYAEAQCMSAKLVIHSDSQLAIRHHTGEYKCKNQVLASIMARAKTIGKHLDYVFVNEPRNKMVEVLGH